MLYKLPPFFTLFGTLLKICCLTLILSTTLLSCKKDKDKEEEVILTTEDILNDKIEDVIPDKYLDSLKKWGLPINPSTTPPNLLGTFQVKPISLKKSSIANENPGKTFVDAMFQVKNQNNDTFSIDFYGRNFLANRDTSILTTISGEGNKFTIYGKVKSTHQKIHVASFAIILSGELEGENIKNLTYGMINIDESKTAKNIFIPEGDGRVLYDKDLKSEKIRDFFFDED